MPKRRARGEDSIFQIKSGPNKGLWATDCQIGRDPNGKRIRRRLYGKTKEEVAEKRFSLRQDVRAGNPVLPDRTTVDGHFQDWLNAKRADVVSSTHLSYSEMYEWYIKPALGGMKLKAVTYQHVNALYVKLEEEGLSRRTIQYVAVILRAGLDDAVTKGLIAKNPAKLAAKRKRAGEGEEYEARFLNQDELIRFWEAAAGERLEDAFRVAFHSGMRPGEWMGLAWSKIDWSADKIRIDQALHQDKKTGKFSLGRIKTPAGRRTISLAPAAIDALRRQKKRQAAERLRAGERWRNEWDLVFTDCYGGHLRPNNVTRRDLARILLRAKIENVTLHAFRHTHAAALIAMGEDIKTIQRRLGHKSPLVTLRIYGHLMPGKDETAATKMEEFCAALDRLAEEKKEKAKRS